MEENQTIEEQLEIQQQALAKIYKSVEQTRKYILWTGIATIVAFVIPLIALAVIIPRVMNVFTESLGGLL